jgi:hypothetical protein
MRAAGWMLAVLAVVGCAGVTTPTPSPGGFQDIVASLVVRGATITDQVAGDAGCADPTLYGNALRLDVRMPGESDSRPVHLLGWRRQTDYEAAAPAFAACLETYEAAGPESEVTTVETPPWRAFGRDWSAALRSAIERALMEAGRS